MWAYKNLYVREKKSAANRITWVDFGLPEGKLVPAPAVTLAPGMKQCLMNILKLKDNYITLIFPISKKFFRHGIEPVYQSNLLR